MAITLFFLLAALAAYTLFGGADFGGGILEATLRRHPRLQKRLQEVLAPVWEANHVWLIAVIVILFVGFPGVYAELCTKLFVPVSLALLGIILRGAFFTFRKYDPEPAARLPVYSFLFRASSALTPMMFGIIIASLLRPFPVDAAAGFAALYVEPWASLFGLLCAVFIFALFGYVAAVFFYGEVNDDGDRRVVRTRIWYFFFAAFFAGGIVLGYGALHGIVHVPTALTPVQAVIQVVAAACLPWLWISIRKNRTWSMRFAAGTQVLCILAGWFATQFPVFMRLADGTAITFADGAAPPITLRWLNIGLVVVLSLVVPLLVYLYRVFAASSREEP